MTAARRLAPSPTPPAPFLKIWTGEADDSAHTISRRVYAETSDFQAPTAHRSNTPVRNPALPLNPLPDQDEAAYQAAARLAEEFAPVEMCTADRRRYARSNIRTYFAEYFTADMKPRAANTIATYRHALQLWERFAPGHQLHGMPLDQINEGYIKAFQAAAVAKLGAATVNSRCMHLQTILNHAAKNGVIKTPAPRLRNLPVPPKKTTIFSTPQIEAVYWALKGNVSLQVAFVLALNAGPRPVDLFLLHRDNITWTGRPSITFTARKTRKTQTLPLAEITLKHLARLPNPPESQGYLFGHLTDINAKDPERSRAARDRNEEFGELLKIADIDFRKPWQAARATCNERLESHREGAGQFMLGHGSTLNSKSYREPSKLIYEAVNSVPQPDCFHHF